MDVSVVICTWNRSRLLRQTLESLTRLRVPEDCRWELLVVDNNSTDDTAAVIESFESMLPVRRVFEPEQGSSHARNRGTRVAHGECLLFTDDDVIVDQGWLAAWLAAFRERQADAVFGGTSLPVFEGDAPDWARRALDEYSVTGEDVLDGPYCRVVMPTVPLALDGTKLPFGVNMAFRTRVIRRYAFDTALGPRADGGILAEETELIRAILRDGHTGRWVPDAIVYHVIPPERQSVAYIGRYFRAWGATLAATASPSAKRGVLRQPLWVWRQALTGEVRYHLRSVLRSTPGTWVRDRAMASRAWGRLLGPPSRRG